MATYSYLKFYEGIPDCQIDIYDTKLMAAIASTNQHTFVRGASVKIDNCEVAY